jgi:hypothetical protein
VEAIHENGKSILQVSILSKIGYWTMATLFVKNSVFFPSRLPSGNRLISIW